MTLPLIRPMLASPSTKAGGRRAIDLSTLVGGTHLFDLKLDGLRAILYWDGSTMKLINRSGVDITHKFPDVEAVGPALAPAGPLILDGELVCASGLFGDVATRGKQEKPAAIAAAASRLPARFVAFDLLYTQGQSIMHNGYATRRMSLQILLERIADPLLEASVVSDNGIAFWNSVTELGLEGIIAKDREAPYAQGKRSPSWLKFKTTRRITCIATGYEKGEGARVHFGAAFLTLLAPDMTPTPVGKVGTGFKADEILKLKSEIDAGQFPIVEIEALNLGSGGQLRFPVFKGWRTDLTVADCTVDQLEQLPRC